MGLPIVLACAVGAGVGVFVFGSPVEVGISYVFGVTVAVLMQYFLGGDE